MNTIQKKHVFKTFVVVITLLVSTISAKAMDPAFSNESDPFAEKNRAAFSVGTKTDTRSVQGEILDTEMEQVLSLLNEERENAGLSPLLHDETLQAGALQRAAEVTVLWSHTRPDGSDCFTVAQGVNGENLAMGYGNADAVMEGWMDSTGHRQNMLKFDYTRVAVACLEVDGIYYWVQLFGK